MILALKRRCRNVLQRRQRRRNFARRCEINFLPLVYMENDDTKTQVLTCRSNAPGFAECPELRSINDTSELICNPIKENTKRCETSHDLVSTSCRPFEICDQAILLSGGWNRWNSRIGQHDNIRDMYHMLRRHSFKRKNIEVFYANGAHGIIANPGNLTTVDDARARVHPAAFKLAMRYHVQRLCSSPHCVDSFVFYMNSPAKHDGSSLLWDIDADGEASVDEVYSLDELLADLSHCEARQVHLIVDQSYSGEIARAFRRSKSHSNVMVFASSKDHEYSYGSDFTQYWSETNHTSVCMKDVHRESKRVLQNSIPDSAIGEATENVNIFGAPCDVVPPFTHKELQQNYLGCQNLPTALWVMSFVKPPFPQEGLRHHLRPHSPENSDHLLTRHRNTER
ncbi:hypothetical protein CAPTEDRAFT_184149 [Capitella teleta]|uniref:Uncharacterized protein n=1 Tax=Capitella teleta TaxID=283909 RepID=R7UHV9_CAPTE|nr:hypothetical protein CAPTEDRAFT_184149 [Capitella teleta]|eukprot:ELU05668.1 hypothetical protein CAPTEDRAFT_184149 [Capitella teleta]